MKYVPKEIETHFKTVDEEIAHLEELCEIAPLHLIELMFVEGRWEHLFSANIEYRLPFVFPYIHLVKEIMKFFEPEWVLTNDHQYVWDSDGSAGRFLKYRKAKGLYWNQFTIAFRSDTEGSTCVLNKIGEKSVPVYEVICSNGALEDLYAESD